MARRVVCSLAHDSRDECHRFASPNFRRHAAEAVEGDALGSTKAHPHADARATAVVRAVQGGAVLLDSSRTSPSALLASRPPSMRSIRSMQLLLFGRRLLRHQTREANAHRNGPRLVGHPFSFPIGQLTPDGGFTPPDNHPAFGISRRRFVLGPHQILRTFAGCEVRKGVAYKILHGIWRGQKAFPGHSGQCIRPEPDLLVGADVRSTPVAAVVFDGHEEKRLGTNHCGRRLGSLGGNVLLPCRLASGQREKTEAKW